MLTPGIQPRGGILASIMVTSAHLEVDLLPALIVSTTGTDTIHWYTPSFSPSLWIVGGFDISCWAEMV